MDGYIIGDVFPWLAGAFSTMAAAVATFFAARSSGAARDQALAARDQALIAQKTVVQLEQQHAAEHIARRMDIHRHFQSEIRGIQRELPVEVNDLKWTPTASHERTVRMYWYVVFDEWLVTTHGDPSLRILWQDFYRNGVRSALRLPAFRHSVEEMFESGSSFLGQGDKGFKQEINQLCLEANNESLRLVLQPDLGRSPSASGAMAALGACLDPSQSRPI